MSKVGNIIGSLAQKAMSKKRGDMARYKYAKKVARNFDKSLDHLLTEQFESLRKMVRYAYKNCPWYRTHFAAVGYRPGDIKNFSDISRLPVLTKRDLRQNLDGLLSEAVPVKERAKSISGGTTGRPVSFYREKRSQAYKRGIDLALFRHYGWKDGQWQGWLWAAPRDLDEPETFTERIKNLLAERTYCLDAKHLSDESYETFVQDTIKYKPPVISAYPSLAYDLAERIEAGRVTPVRVPVVTVTAEPLYDFQREKIEKYLADKVYDRYGSREFGTAAFECDYKDGMHIFTESVYIETLESEYADDNIGTIVVTDLLNHAMPLIRYRIGDFGRVEYKPCNCGLSSPRLFDVRGRETDIIWRPDGSGISGTMLIGVITRFTIDANVQIVQKKLDEITVRVEGDPTDYSEEIEHMKNTLDDELGGIFNIVVEGVKEIKRAPSGKYRYIISEIKKP